MCFHFWQVGIDRYIAASRPHQYRHYMSPRRCCCVLLGLWTVASITFIFPLLISDNFIYYQFSYSQYMCGLHWSFRWYCVITGIYIPILSGTILVYTAYYINKSLRKVADRHAARSNPDMQLVATGTENDVSAVEFGTNQTEPNTSNELTSTSKISSIQKRNKRAHVVLIVTATAYFLCWGPYVTLVVVLSIVPSLQAPDWLLFSTIWLANSNSMINVVIYSVTNRAFRDTCIRKLKELIACCKCLSK